LPDGSKVLLGVDDPHAGGPNNKMVNVGFGASYPAVVQGKTSRSLRRPGIQPPAHLLFTVGPDLPGTDVLRYGGVRSRGEGGCDPAEHRVVLFGLFSPGRVSGDGGVHAGLMAGRAPLELSMGGDPSLAGSQLAGALVPLLRRSAR
jgi:hypothetical protein